MEWICIGLLRELCRWWLGALEKPQVREGPIEYDRQNTGREKIWNYSTASSMREERSHGNQRREGSDILDGCHSPNILILWYLKIFIRYPNMVLYYHSTYWIEFSLFVAVCVSFHISNILCRQFLSPYNESRVHEKCVNSVFSPSDCRALSTNTLQGL